MGESKVISIIIPAYKSSQFIEEALQSIADQQEVPDYSVEILLGIDNCEETLHAVKSLHGLSNKLRVFYFNEQCGPYIIRNTLAQLSQASILLFFDADDIMPPLFIQRIIKSFKSNDVVLMCYTNFIDENRKIKVKDFEKIESLKTELLGKRPNKLLKNSILDRFLKNIKAGNSFKFSFYRHLFYRSFDSNFYLAGVFAIKRKTFINMQGYRPWPIEADSEFLLRMQLSNVKFEFSSKKNAFMRRIHPANLTMKRDTSIGSALREKYANEKYITAHISIPITVTGNFTILHL